MSPCLGTYYSLPFLPPTPSSLSGSLEGVFEPTRRPSWTIDLPLVLLLKLNRNKDTGRCARPGEEVQGCCQLQLLLQTLIVRLVKAHFFHIYSIVKSQQNRIELGTRPGTLCVNIDLRHLPKTFLDWLGGKSASSFDNKYNRT